jgi:hypothetical protein
MQGAWKWWLVGFVSGSNVFEFRSCNAAMPWRVLHLALVLLRLAIQHSHLNQANVWITS